MTLAGTYLALASLGLLASLATWFRLRIAGPLLIPTFLVGWLRGELALQTIAFELIATAAFLAGGVHRAPAGRAGLALAFVSWALLVAAHRRGVASDRIFAAALSPLGIEPARDVSPIHGLLRPFAFDHPQVLVERGIEYGPALPRDKGGRNLLDLRRPRDAKAGDRRPMLLQIHGGGWIIGDKREQGLPLMTHLAARGWICAASNYRLSPLARMPDHVVDVKRALVWLRQNAERLGGDPEFICLTGGSAGGHLSSLAALSPGDPRFQPGFESADTRVAACVPFYGIFDFLDRAGDRRFGKMADSIGPMIFERMPDADPEGWDAVCPITRVNPAAPPFFVIHGSHDALAFVEEGARFVEALRAQSRSVVAWAELPGAQHAFEIFHSPRSAHAVRAVTAFLEHVHAAHRAEMRAAKQA